MSKFLIALLFILGTSVQAQDTLLLLTGRKIVVSSVDLKDYTIAYRGMKEGSKVKKIDPMRVFSVIYRDGHERIVYQSDSLDPIDFSVGEMRKFITGEIDARNLYHNNVVKGLGIGIGGGSSLLAIYGLVGPALYATAVGSFSPNIEEVLSFNVKGNATEDLGIPSGKYMNEVTGSKSSPVIGQDKFLKLSGKKILFTGDTNLDSAIAMINAAGIWQGIHAANDNGKIKLFKSENTSLLQDPSYREGFEKRVRDYKIRSAMLSGLIGFVAGSIAFSIALND